MRAPVAVIVAALLVGSCNGSRSPSAPTPTAVTPPVVTTPPVVSPPVVPPPAVVTPPTPPAPMFPPNDPRFDVSYYRQLVHNAYETRGALEPLRRQRVAPRIYLRTVDDAGRPLDALTLNATASALESVAGSLTGVFGLAGLERGTDTREGQSGWITVRWSASEELAFSGEYSVCGRGFVGGDRLILYPRSPGCRCSGGPAVNLATVKHELGHVLGFWHTSSREDLMYAVGTGQCDMNPSEREKYHASVAYQRPIGSVAP